MRKKTWGKRCWYQKCNFSLLFINHHRPKQTPVQNSQGWNGHHSKWAAHKYPSGSNKPRAVSWKELLRGLGSRDNTFFWLFILVLNQIHSLHKQLKLYIFQSSSDSLYEICKTFNFRFSVSCTSVLWGIFSTHTPLWCAHSILLATGLALCPHTKP